MAIVTFECDICKRKIDKPQNKTGLEVVGRCIITEGCKGSLHRTGFSANHVSGKHVPIVEGLTDWSQRKVLYTHQQTTLADSWKIKHHLNNNPTVQVVIQANSLYPDQLTEIIPDRIEYTDANELTIYLQSKYKGIAQCIALSTSTPAYKPETVSTISTLQLTTKSELTIATLDSVFDPDLPVNVTVTFLSPANLSVVLEKTYAFDTTPGVDSSWKSGTTSKVLINGRIYTVRSCNIDADGITSVGVETGMPFYVSTIDSVTPQDNELIILLTNMPYETVDINVNEIIDASKVTVATAGTSFYYSKQAFYSYSTTKEKIYPPVRKI